ncbi:MAG: hypothetical protein AAFN09_08510 [Pseudomonadota bacterium]
MSRPRTPKTRPEMTRAEFERERAARARAAREEAAREEAATEDAERAKAATAVSSKTPTTAIAAERVERLPDRALHVIAAGTKLRDARFRRHFAIALFLLFALVIVSMLGLLFTANLLLIRGADPALSTAMMQAAKDGIPIALSAVTGVFGTAVGFFFGSESGD